MYAELHCHSAYSFGDGASEPAELAAAAAERGYEALAITDHDGVSGAMEFAHACARGRRAGRSSGAELTVEGGCHITLLVESTDGLGQPLPADHEGARGHPRGRGDARSPAALAAARRARGARRGARLPVGLRARRRARRPLGARRSSRRRGDGAAAALGIRARAASGSSCSAPSGATTARATAGWPPSPPALGVPCVATGNVHAHDRSRARRSRTRWSRSAWARPSTRARGCGAATRRRC